MSSTYNPFREPQDFVYLIDGEHNFDDSDLDLEVTVAESTERLDSNNDDADGLATPMFIFLIVQDGQPIGISFAFGGCILFITVAEA